MSRSSAALRVSFQGLPMQITIKPVEIIGFIILKSVGDGGTNLEDDVLTVKTLLNGIDAAHGGAENSLEAEDAGTTGPEWSNTLKAILAFQAKNLSHLFTPDGLIEPNRSTIKRLKDEFFRNKDRRTVAVSEGAPLSGFSRFRIRRTGGRFVSDLSSPICQMVPVGGSRNLLVSTGKPGARVGLRLPDPAHTRVFTAPGVVTVRGLTPGEDLGHFTIDGVPANAIRLIVRAARSMTVNFHALADPKSGKGAVGMEPTADALIAELNRLSQGQANLRFIRGKFQVLDGVAGRRFDFARPIVVDSRERNPNQTDPANQLFTFGAFLPAALNAKKEINVFIVPGMVAKALGRGAGTSSITDDLLCWVKADLLSNASTRPLLVGHEIGHLLQFTHLDDFRGTLMFPALSGSGPAIPAETLEQMVIP